MMTRDEFNVHCNLLSAIVEQRAQAALKRHGFKGYIGSAFSPSTFPELRARYHLLRFTQARYFPVLNTHCDYVIYSSAHVNMLYRAWHDLTHVELDRGFGYEDELKIALHKSREIPIGAMRNIMLADAFGESEFAEATGGKFPLYQRDFAYDYVVHGSRFAIEAHRSSTA
jgi:hypothetical protein